MIGQYSLTPLYESRSQNLNCATYNGVPVASAGTPYRAQGKATSGAIMRAHMGCAHAGDAALHVHERLSHGASDPLQLWPPQQPKYEPMRYEERGDNDGRDEK